MGPKSRVKECGQATSALLGVMTPEEETNIQSSSLNIGTTCTGVRGDADEI